VLVSGWVLRRATGYTVFEQFDGVLNPLLASLLMAAVVIATRLQLSANIGAGLRLAVLIPLATMVFAGAFFLLDRQLVKDFLMFARITFDGTSKKLELPQANARMAPLPRFGEIKQLSKFLTRVVIRKF
jgi:hypothetical protein